MRSQANRSLGKRSSAVLLAAALLSLAEAAHAQEIYYFSDTARDVTVSADDQTLLAFPAAAYLKVCQPQGVVELYPVESADELQSMMLRSGAQYRTLADSRQGADAPGGAGDVLARHLKLVPLKPGASTACSIRLVDEQVVNVRFVPTKMVAKPSVEFRSGLEKARSGSAITASLGSLNLFRSFALGGEMPFLVDETPSESATGEGGERRTTLRRSTDLATYRLVYVGTDKEHFKAWKFEGEADKAFRAKPIKGARIGDFYFSAFRPMTVHDKVAAVPANHLFEKGEKFVFYVVSRSDISVSDMLGRLP